MDELKLKKIMINRGLAVIGDSISAEEKAKNMYKTLCIIIPPESISDRTNIHNIVKFYSDIANSKGEQPDSIFKILIDFALEASGPFSRVPAAVFMSILKKELGYLKNDTE